MKESICTAIGITGSFIAGLFGGFDVSMVTLIAFMAVDYVIGLILAVVRKSPKTDTDLITINGHEYFSNGIFYVLND